MLQSDLNIDVSRLRSDAIPEVTKQFNQGLISTTSKGPQWFEVGPAKYREMRLAGKTAFPPPTYLDGTAVDIPSRESGRSIPCRIIKPDGDAPIKGIFMHVHGGGWVLMDEKSQDPLLKDIANSAVLLVISVGYRLAPEHPFPQGPEDCYDVADWLVDNAEKEYNASLQFISGDSAGGHLSVLSAFHLVKSRPKFDLSGLVLNFGAYDLSMLPNTFTFKPKLVLTKDAMDNYIKAVCPGMSQKDLKAPEISPLYADLGAMKLPPALFNCGTADVLLDDSVLMAAKWQIAGHESILKLYHGAAHGFIVFPQDKVPAAKECMEYTAEFLRSKLR